MRSTVSRAKFTEQYNKWCHKYGYNRSDSKAAEFHDLAREQIAALPATPETKVLVSQAVSQLNCISATLTATRQEMQRLAFSLPEYPVVLAMSGVGEALGPQIDVRRFFHRGALVAFVGVDAPPQSVSFEASNRSISKYFTLVRPPSGKFQKIPWQLVFHPQPLKLCRLALTQRLTALGGPLGFCRIPAARFRCLMRRLFKYF